MVIPDLNPPDLPAASLGESYVLVREAAGDVAQGRASLDSLVQATNNLAQELGQMGRALRGYEGSAFDPKPFLGPLEQAHAGLDKMRSFERSCAIADLNQGWSQLLRAALAIQELSEKLPKP